MKKDCKIPGEPRRCPRAGAQAFALTARARPPKLGYEMKKLIGLGAAALLAASVAVIAAVPAFALEGPGAGFVTQQQAASTHDVVPTVIWVIVSVLLACLAGGILYLFKRRIGAYPKNPSWVAPISIMLSRDLPGDEEAHEAHADSTHDVTTHGASAH